MSKIFLKVIASYCLFLGLLITIAGFGVYSVASLRSADQRVFHEDVAIGMAAKDLRFSISRVRQKEKSSFIAIGRQFDPQRNDHVSQEIKGYNLYVGILIEDIDKLSQLPVSKASRDFLLNMKSETRLYQTEMNAIYHEIEKGKILSAREADDRLLPYKKYIRDNREGIQEIFQQSKNNVESATLQLETSSKKIETTILFLAGIATLLGLLAAAYTSRLLARSEKTNAQLNQELELRVKARTQALQESNQNLKKTSAHLEGAKNELVKNEKLVSLGSLVAGVAHELNTPIGMAVLSATTLQDDVRDFKHALEQGISKSALTRHLDHSAEGLRLITKNLSRAAQLIGNFKEFSVDQTSERRRSFCLAEVVREIVLSLGATLKTSTHSLQIAIPENIVMDAYPGPLGQICINLINNALIHGLEGQAHGSIQISAQQIDEEYVELRISDNGKGMSEEIAAHVFDPFFSTKIGQGGSGLGMHIVQTIVNKYFGGSISLTTQPGIGSTWILHFKNLAPILQPEVSEFDFQTSVNESQAEPKKADTQAR
jgi:C4-dicarboxylate-specific signal transduction histidine kinase